jgi:surface protein
MEWMFYECFQLTSLEISKFSTSKVKTMAAMFVRCRSLTSIDLPSFDTTSVTSFHHAFEDCKSLSSIDLSKFVTSNVETMKAMFLRCDNLTSLDLSNFDTSKVTIMDHMLANNYNLKFINFKKMNIIQSNTSIFKFIDDSLVNPVICIDAEYSFYKVISLYKCLFVNCSSNWGEKQNDVQGEDSNICFIPNPQSPSPSIMIIFF